MRSLDKKPKRINENIKYPKIDSELLLSQSRLFTEHVNVSFFKRRKQDIGDPNFQ